MRRRSRPLGNGLPGTRPRSSSRAKLKARTFVAVTLGGGVLAAVVYLLSTCKVLSGPIYYTGGAGLVLAGIGFLVARAIKQRPKDKAPGHAGPTQPQPAAPFMTRRVLLVVAGTLIGELLVVGFSPLLRSAIILEVAYYGVLIVSGAALGTARHVPILASTVVLLVVSGAGAVIFLATPGARLNYGPEISIFAIEGHLSRMTMLPLDIAVVLSSWRVARELSRRRTKSSASPTDSTSPSKN